MKTKTDAEEAWDNLPRREASEPITEEMLLNLGFERDANCVYEAPCLKYCLANDQWFINGKPFRGPRNCEQLLHLIDMLWSKPGK